MRERRDRTFRGAGGFSLIEILVVVAIFGMLSLMLYEAFRDTLKTERRVSRSQERWHVLRIALDRMARELSMAFVSLNENLNAPNRRTYFVAKKGFDGDELTFTAFAHRPFVENARESDSAAIRYFVAPDPEDPTKKDLWRRETRRLGYERFEDLPGETYVLVEDIQGISYEFYDNVKDEWVDEWDTTSLDGQPNRLPPRVRISLTVLDEKGRELTLVTEARIRLTDALNLSPPAVGGIYGPGGPVRRRGRSSLRRGGGLGPSGVLTRGLK